MPKWCAFLVTIERQESGVNRKTAQSAQRRGSGRRLARAGCGAGWCAPQPPASTLFHDASSVLSYSPHGVRWRRKRMGAWPSRSWLRFGAGRSGERSGDEKRHAAARFGCLSIGGKAWSRNETCDPRQILAAEGGRAGQIHIVHIHGRHTHA